MPPRLNPYIFTVTYSDNTAVAASSLAGAVVDVSPPGGGAAITATVISTKAVGPTDPFGDAQAIRRHLPDHAPRRLLDGRR